MEIRRKNLKIWFLNEQKQHFIVKLCIGNSIKASKESELNQVTEQRFEAISLELASLEAKLLDVDQAGSAGRSGTADDAQFSLINSQLQVR